MACCAHSRNGFIPGVISTDDPTAGRSPARNSDDFPDPDGPTTTSGIPLTRQSASSLSSRSVSSLRPKNTSASSRWNARSPRYGFPVDSAARPFRARSAANASKNSSCSSPTGTPIAVSSRENSLPTDNPGRCRPVQYPEIVADPKPLSAANVRQAFPDALHNASRRLANSSCVFMATPTRDSPHCGVPTRRADSNTTERAVIASHAVRSAQCGHASAVGSTDRGEVAWTL